MQNLTTAAYCETRFEVGSQRYNICLNEFLNLGLISEVTNDIADIYACATTEEQAYCVSKAKSYGIFTGVNGSKYNQCIADICAAKQPELTNNLLTLAEMVGPYTIFDSGWWCRPTDTYCDGHKEHLYTDFKFYTDGGSACCYGLFDMA